MHVRNVGQLALEYETDNRTLPDSLQALQDWAVENHRAKPADFQSTRDGKPYDFSVEPTGPVVAEHTGLKGSRYKYAPKKDGSSRPTEEKTPAANQEPVPAPTPPKPAPKGPAGGVDKKP
jgi:hypothetical protein